MTFTVFAVPADLVANAAVAVPARVTVSLVMIPFSAAVPVRDALVVRSYSLFAAVIPVTVSSLAVTSAVSPVGWVRV